MFVGWLFKTKELGNFGAASSEHFNGHMSSEPYPVENKRLIQRTSCADPKIQRASNVHGNMAILR